MVQKSYTGTEIKKLYRDIFSSYLKLNQKDLNDKLEIKYNKKGDVISFSKNKLIDLVKDELKDEPNAVKNMFKG